MTDAVRVAAHAKINLFLRILAREHGGSGFHQLETAFALLELADELVVRRTATPGDVALTVNGPDLGRAEENLAVRAAQGVLAATGRKFGVAIELTKRIPVQAGLGGGSSDAAAALHAVNALAGGAVPREELLHFAARLGSDVPFFTSGAAAALGWGRGERLFRLAPLPTAPALVAFPSTGVATPDAYRWWDELHAAPPSPARGPVVLDAAALASWGSVGRLASPAPRPSRQRHDRHGAWHCEVRSGRLFRLGAVPAGAPRRARGASQLAGDRGRGSQHRQLPRPLRRDECAGAPPKRLHRPRSRGPGRAAPEGARSAGHGAPNRAAQRHPARHGLAGGGAVTVCLARLYRRSERRPADSPVRSREPR